MIWIVTTKEEAVTICHGNGVEDFSSGLAPMAASVIYAETRNDLGCIGRDDMVLARTKRLDVLNWIKLTGARNTAESISAITCDYNKEIMKTVLRANGIRVPWTYDIESLPDDPFLVFVKPLELGDSIGINGNSICRNRKEVESQMEWIVREYNAVPIIEEYVGGYDATVGVINTEDGVMARGVVIDSPSGLLDFDTKANDRECYQRFQGNTLVEIAVKAFRAVGATKYGRVDFRVAGGMRPYVLEINLCPGLSRNGYMYKCFEGGEESGMGYRDFLQSIISTMR